MKIVDIQTKLVGFQRRKVFKIAFGTGSDRSNRIYVKIITDSGIYGLGEAAPSPLVAGETLDGVVAAVAYMKPVLIGMDPTDIASIHNVMDKRLLFNPAAKAAIDVACYDIIGKHAGKPVHKLLGANTDVLQTDITIGIDSVEEMVRECLERVGEGFRILKIKCGIDPAKDIEVLRQIRSAVGDQIDLRIDINQGYDVETALYVLRAIEKFHITEAEQPLPYWDIHGMAEIKKYSPIPIMADESVHTPEQARIVCQHDAADILNIKFMKCGGIYKALQNTVRPAWLAVCLNLSWRLLQLQQLQLQRIILFRLTWIPSSPLQIQRRVLRAASQWQGIRLPCPMVPATALMNILFNGNSTP